MYSYLLYTQCNLKPYMLSHVCVSRLVVLVIALYGCILNAYCRHYPIDNTCIIFQLAVEAYVNERQHITLELVGNMPGSKPAEPASSQPPDAAEILDNIRRGVVAVHADRAEVTKKQLQVQMNTIRRNAVNHGTLAQNIAWSTDCDAALMAWLQSKKDGRARASSSFQCMVPMLALPPPEMPTVPMLALPPPEMPIDDDRSVPPPEMPIDDDHSVPPDEGSKDQGCDDGSSSSSSSSSISVSTSGARAPLTKDERTLLEELIEAVKVHQEIEVENDRLHQEIRQLKAELALYKNMSA